MWLKSLVWESGEKGKLPRKQRHEKGVLQDGIILPLLLNFYLHWLERALGNLAWAKPI